MSALNPDLGDHNELVFAFDHRFAVFEKLLYRKCSNAAFNALVHGLQFLEQAILLESNENGTENRRSQET